VRIIAPSQHEDQFVNIKGYHSINVQVVVNADSQFINIVAKWPGSSHDSRVLKESEIFRYLEQSNIDGYLLDAQLGNRKDGFIAFTVRLGFCLKLLVG
jgi:hypothetical protein